MGLPLSHPKTLWVQIGALATLIIAGFACSLAMNALAPLEGARHVWNALVLDLVVGFPLACYLLVIRAVKWPLVSVAPAVAGGFICARNIIPGEHAALLSILKPLALLSEIGILGYLIAKAIRMKRVPGSQAVDPLSAFESAASEIVHSKSAARMLASEVAVVYYGLNMRPRTHIPDGFTPIAAHVKSGHGGLALATIAILTLEGLVVHVFLSQWSPIAAWVMTLLTSYSALWVIADYRAAVRRPSLLGPSKVIFRAGLRWEVEVPRHLIRSVSGPSTASPEQQGLNMTFLGQPSVWIVLSKAVTVRGPYGIQRQVSAIGLEPDGPLVL